MQLGEPHLGLRGSITGCCCDQLHQPVRPSSSSELKKAQPAWRPSPRQAPCGGGGGSNSVSSSNRGGGNGSSTVAAVADSPNGRDHHAWTAEIFRLTKSGHPRHALAAYAQMLSTGGAPPTSYALVAALTACKHLKDLPRTRQVHADAAAAGLDGHPYVGTALVDAYARCGCPGDARRAFDAVPPERRSTAAWNALILGCARAGAGGAAWRAYERMRTEGAVPPDHRTFVGALKAACCCCDDEGGGSSRKEQRVRAVHARAREFGADGDAYVGAALVEAYARCGLVPELRDAFARVRRPDAVVWGAAVAGCAEAGDGEAAWELYESVRREGAVVPDDHVLVAAVKACKSVLLPVGGGDGAAEGGQQRQGVCLERVRRVHADVVRCGRQAAARVGTALVDVYVKCGSVADARRAFDAVAAPDAVAWSAIILGYAQSQGQQEALRLYERMRRDGRGVPPDEATFVAALKACSALAAAAAAGAGGAAEVQHRATRASTTTSTITTSWCLAQVRTIHSHMTGTSTSPHSLCAGTSLIDAYAKCGALAAAHTIFTDMPHRDAITWTAIISAYAHTRPTTALSLYHTHLHSSSPALTPTPHAHAAAIRACAALSSLSTGTAIHASLPTATLAHPYVATALIHMYAQCGAMPPAHAAFLTLPHPPPLPAWTALMSGYARHGQSAPVLALFRAMLAAGLRPDGVAYLAVLAACNHAGAVDAGRGHLAAMSARHGLAPAPAHHACVVDMLGRAGRVAEAAEAAAAAGSQAHRPPDPVAWKSVLGAARKWGDVGVGERAFRALVGIDPADAAAYVVMANIYEAAGMRAAARQVERERVRRGAWKEEPGRSRCGDVDVALAGGGGTGGGRAAVSFQVARVGV